MKQASEEKSIQARAKAEEARRFEQKENEKTSNIIARTKANAMKLAQKAIIQVEEQEKQREADAFKAAANAKSEALENAVAAKQRARIVAADALKKSESEGVAAVRAENEADEEHKKASLAVGIESAKLSELVGSHSPLLESIKRAEEEHEHMDRLTAEAKVESSSLRKANLKYKQKLEELKGESHQTKHEAQMLMKKNAEHEAELESLTAEAREETTEAVKLKAKINLIKASQQEMADRAKNLRVERTELASATASVETRLTQKQLAEKEKTQATKLEELKEAAYVAGTAARNAHNVAVKHQ
jgi:hypothetical protein